MRNYELIDLRQKGLASLSFFPEQSGVPSYDELILVTNAAAAHDPRIARFPAVLTDGTACLLKDPGAIWRAFIADHPDLDARLNQAAWQASLGSAARDPAHLDGARYAAFTDFLVKHGVLKHALPVSAHAQ